MEELKAILLAHGARYPAMEPTDGVKLLYQNEFGGGHLIADEEKCINYLYREYAQVPHDRGLPLWEDIGNGLVRCNLGAMEEKDLPALGEAFLRSARRRKGSLPSFLEKLSLLRLLTQEGVFSFDLAALDSYLASYRQAGYPTVSHSEIYRQTYRPAYRVVALEELQGGWKP